jgi:hypothetical protein
VADDAVLDVTVGESETEVAVVSGRVRVKSLDERRQIDLHAGYTGYASLRDEPLAVRRGPDQRLEAVRPIVVPALHPHRPAGASTAPDAAGTGTPAIAAPATAAPAPPASLPAAAMAPAHEGSAYDAPPSPIVAPLAQAPLAQVDVEPAPQSTEPEQAEQIRRRFDGLTEGLLDGLLPALPQDLKGDGR